MQYNDNDKGCVLPQEIMQQILVEACGPPTTSRKTIVGKTDTCTNTLLKLCLVSKDMNEFAMTRLYAAVRLPKPSTLRAFQQTLSSWPFLGRLVKSLHIGADRPLESDWWPIHLEMAKGRERTHLFRLNLDAGSERRQNEGTRPYYEVNLEHYEDSEDSKALRSVFGAAFRQLDVSPTRPFYDYSISRDISSDAWHVRTLEAQAALELYHLHLKPAQAAGQLLPQLLLDGAQPTSAENVVRITRQQIYSRMMRSSAPTDSFHHPLLFARCGLEWQAMDQNGAMRTPRRPPIYETKDPSDVFAWPKMSQRIGDLTGAQTIHYPSDLSSALDPAIPPSATVSGNLALARSVLALTPRVSSLSLTGVFEWSVVGERFAPALPALHSLTLGPSPAWQLLLRYDHLALMGIKTLRICSNELGTDELEQLTDENGLLGTVRKIQWSLPARYRNVERQPQRLITVINKLIGLDSGGIAHHGQASSAMQQDHSRGWPSRATKRPYQQDRSPRDPVYIEVRLHPLDLALLLNAAPSKQVAEAWSAGTAVPGIPRRLKLCSHQFYFETKRELDALAQALYDDEGSSGRRDERGASRRVTHRLRLDEHVVFPQHSVIASQLKPPCEAWG